MNLPATNVEAGVQRVFETMFFRDLEPAPAPEMPAQMPSAPVYQVEVRFEGGAEGVCELIISAPEAVSLAADFLAGDEPEPEEGQVVQVLRELGNMVCGSLLSQHEPEAQFRILSPVCTRREVFEEALGPGWQKFRMEGGELLARLSVGD